MFSTGKRGEPKSNNQLRTLIHSVETLGSRGLRALLSRADVRMVNKFIRIMQTAVAEAEYVMNNRLLYEVARRRRSHSVRVPKRVRQVMVVAVGGGGGGGRGRSKFPWVYYRKDSKKWAARVRIGNKRVYLGAFDTELKAHRAVLRFKNKRRK